MKKILCALIVVSVILTIFSSCGLFMKDKEVPDGEFDMTNVVLPKANKPADKLAVFDVRLRYGEGTSASYYYERMMIKTLQGLVNREKPQLFIIMTDDDEFWLQELIDRKYITGTDGERMDEIGQLLEKYKSFYKGAVVGDDGLTMGGHIGIPVAACENLILTSDVLAEQYNMDVKENLKGKFTTNAEGVKWVWDKYKSQLNQKFFAAFHPDVLAMREGSVDYLVACKGFPIWAYENSAVKLNGVDPDADLTVLTDILMEAPTFGVCMGFWWYGAESSSKGLGEVGGVKLINSTGKILIAGGFPNITVYSGYQKAELKQAEQPKITKLEDKLYAVLLTTDGDAQQIWYQNMNDWFTSEHYNSVPMGFGMGPALIDLAPVMAEYYYEKTNEKNEIFCDIGVGYQVLNDLCLNKKSEKTATEDEFFWYTNEYVKRMDMKEMRVYTKVGNRFDKAVIERYTSSLKGVAAIFPDWGNYVHPKYTLNEVNYTSNGINVFHPLNTWEGGIDGLAKEIDEINQQRIDGGGGPGFAYIFVNLWYYQNMTDMKYLSEHVSKDVEFLTPSQFTAAYDLSKNK